MRKKILVIVLAMTLVFAYAVPVAATAAESVIPEIPAVEDIAESVDIDAVTDESITPNGTVTAEVVSEDPTIQAAYDAYVKMMEAYAVNDYETVESSFEQLDEITFDFTEEQDEEWNAIIEEKVGVEQFLVDVLSVGIIIYAVEMQEAYKADPNAKTAYEFVDAYNLCTEAELPIESMVPGIGADYETATADTPSENVVKVYEAYAELAEALKLAWYDEDFIKVCENFEAVLDAFNELTEAELDDLAALMGVEDGEAAWNQVFTDWVNANMILEIGEVYDAFLENKNADTAKAYVEAYDSIVNDTEFLTQEDKNVILAFFADGSYELAKEYLVEEPAADTEEPVTEEPVTEVPETEAPSAETLAQTDNSDKETPQTGDETNMLAPFAVMIAAAGVAVLAAKRRKVQ